MFQTALERERGSPSGELLYALGNCALELGRPAEAVWHYRRALLRLPRSPELRKNLALALSDLGHDPHPTTLSARTDDLLDRLTRDERIATALAAQTALLALLLAVRRRRILRLLVAATLLVVAGLAVREIPRDFAPPHPRAVVLDARVALRTEPHPSSAPLAEILGGTSCHVIEASDRWAFVTIDDTEGWLERRLLGTID